MLEIDTTTMTISLTRGDSASIVFSAVDENGDPWNPSEGDEKLTFAVAKKWGGEVLMEVENEYDETREEPLADFWTINITADKWLDNAGNDKFKFSDYVFDVQVSTSTGADTIIGKTNNMSPTFRVLGEVAVE